MAEITYQDIQKANATIKTTDIRGKEYAEVVQRVKAFRMVYPDGTITTQILSDEGGRCVIVATVAHGHLILATGTAYEKEGANNINRTSYIENCETSAVGRALGFAGFGIDTSIASAEEVQNAINGQEGYNPTPKPQRPAERLTEAPAAISPEQAEKLTECCRALNINIPVLLRRHKVKSVEELTGVQYTAIMTQIQRHMAEKGGNE